MTYFTTCQTIDEVKKEFKTLCKKLHPDCGGSEEAFKAMYSEYEAAFDRLNGVHRAEDGTTYRKETTETPAQYAEAIKAVMNLDGVEIELVGSWIWLQGNTFPVKDIIKAAGYMWSSKHKKWFYNGEPTKSRRHGKLTFQQIEALHGAAFLKKVQQPRLATA